MANPCTNLFYASVKEDNITEFHEKIYQIIYDFLQEKLTVTNVNEDECFLELEFDSKWSFPNEIMNALTNKIEQEFSVLYKQLYIRCLSYEFGCDYVEYMIFENGEWNSIINPSFKTISHD